jgi:hypothetical protein
MILLVLEGFLEFNLYAIGFDFGKTEELLIDVLIGIGVWTS